MPYATVADLPDRVKQHIPSHAQHIFLHVWNSVYEKTGDEKRAFASAWSKVHKNYGNPGNKQWRKRKPFKYEMASKSAPPVKDAFLLIKARKQELVEGTDELWTKMHARPPKAPETHGRVTVRPTEFEFHFPFFIKNKLKRDVFEDIPGANLAGDTTWTVPITNESVQKVAKLLTNKEIYMVDWTELERDPAMQKQRAQNNWGDVPVKDHGRAHPGAKKGRGTAKEIDAAKSEDEADMTLTKSTGGFSMRSFTEYAPGTMNPLREHRVIKRAHAGVGQHEYLHQERHRENYSVQGKMGPWTTTGQSFSHKDVLETEARKALQGATSGRADVEVHHTGVRNTVNQLRTASPKGWPKVNFVSFHGQHVSKRYGAAQHAHKSIEEEKSMGTPIEKAIRDHEGAYYSIHNPGEEKPTRQFRVTSVKNPLTGKREFHRESRHRAIYDEGNARTGLGHGGTKAGEMSDWDTDQLGYKTHQDALDDMAHHVLFKQHILRDMGYRIEIHHAGLKNAVSKARKALPYRQEELPMGKSTENDENFAGIMNLAKSVGYDVPMIFSRHGHPAQSQPCSQCGGTGYIYTPGVDDKNFDALASDAEAQADGMENEAIAQAEQANQFVPDPTAMNPLADGTNPMLLSTNDATAITGRTCTFCKRGEADAATFAKLPDSGYCDDCLMTSRARR